MLVDHRTTLPASSRLIALAIFLILLPIETFAQQQLPALMMPRAAQSLLLDIAKAGTRLVVVGERGHILISDNQGKHFRQVGVPTRALLTAVYFVDSQQGWAVGHDQVILGTTDGGLSWHRLHSAPAQNQAPPPLMDVWFRDAQQGWAVGAFGSFLGTRDGGQTWQNIAERLPNPYELHLNAITGDELGNLYIAGEQGSVFVSHDLGASWSTAQIDYDGSLFGVVTNAQSSETLVFGLRGSLLQSTDKGETWVALATGSDTNLNGGYLDGGQLVLVGLEGTVRLRRSGASDFEAVDAGTRAGFSSVLSLDHSHLLIVGEGGTYPVTIDNNKIRP